MCSRPMEDQGRDDVEEDLRRLGVIGWTNCVRDQTPRTVVVPVEDEEE